MSNICKGILIGFMASALLAIVIISTSSDSAKIENVEKCLTISQEGHFDGFYKISGMEDARTYSLRSVEGEYSSTTLSREGRTYKITDCDKYDIATLESKVKNLKFDIKILAEAVINLQRKK